MLFIVRRRSHQVLAGLALAILVTAGCTSVAENEPSARATTSCEPHRTPDGRAQNHRIEIVMTPVEREIDGH